jgi:hypothetical protein
VWTESELRAPAVNAWTASDVRKILIERGWLVALPDSDADPALIAADAWMAEAAAWLGPHAADREALTKLLCLIFEYDAHKTLASAEAHAVLLREGARNVIRELGLEVLAGPAVDSARFAEIVAAVKRGSGASSRALFHPIRLALAGRAGEGELDRVILLLDSAAATPALARVKTARERMLEFCVVLH